MFADAAAFMAADPAEALRDQIAAGRRPAEQRSIAIAMRLAESVPPGGQRDGLFMVHRHAFERRLDVARRLERIGIAARPLGIDVDQEIGRASCRERVCQYVWISVVAESLKKKKQKNRT